MFHHIGCGWVHGHRSTFPSPTMGIHSRRGVLYRFGLTTHQLSQRRETGTGRIGHDGRALPCVCRRGDGWQLVDV